AALNRMVLAGFVIAIGVIIDDAIIAVDHIIRELRRLRQEGSAESTVTIVKQAALDMGRPVVYATLIVLLAVVPVFFMEGLSGAFFQPLAVSYVMAVLAFLLVALTVTPALTLMLLGSAPNAPAESAPGRGPPPPYPKLLSPSLPSPP